MRLRRGISTRGSIPVCAQGTPRVLARKQQYREPLQGMISSHLSQSTGNTRSPSVCLRELHCSCLRRAMESSLERESEHNSQPDAVSWNAVRFGLIVTFTHSIATFC
uniref:Uncharacterized protein n=1 Tax=Cacopsylla melanoneura TaxID=428564 RepID=A0A8D8QRH0_9HEMI